jgi:DNA polymerase alpha-associated DNA helicase A
MLRTDGIYHAIPPQFYIILADDCYSMNQTMTRLQKMNSEEYSSFVRVLFGLTSPSPVSEDLGPGGVEWVDPSLNDSQKDAIKFALGSREVALIHGPPGVGN